MNRKQRTKPKQKERKKKIKNKEYIHTHIPKEWNHGYTSHMYIYIYWGGRQASRPGGGDEKKNKYLAME